MHASPPDTTWFHVAQDDAVTWLSGLEDASIDLVITDPAYESLEKHRAIGTTTRLTSSKASSNEWFDIFPNARFPELLAELYRVMTRNSHLYIMCDADTMFVLEPMGRAAGFQRWGPLVWDKVTIGTGYHYRRRTEFILFFEKGTLPLNCRKTPDLLSAKRIRKKYPTEKPVSLLETFVRQSSQPGAIVADPFAGSGATGEAACKLGRNFVGCDLKQGAVDRATKRLNAYAEPVALPKTVTRRQLCLEL